MICYVSSRVYLNVNGSILCVSDRLSGWSEGIKWKRRKSRSIITIVQSIQRKVIHSEWENKAHNPGNQTHHRRNRFLKVNQTQLICICVYVYVICKYSANGFFSFVYMHTRTRSGYTVWTRSALDGCKHLFFFSLLLGLTIIWNCLRRNILQYFFFIFTFSPYYTICLLLHFPYKKNKEITLEFFRFLSFLGLYPT